MSSIKSLSLIMSCLVLAPDAFSADPSIRFNRDIRPILSENCFHCHGPDEDARTAGLRLDTEAGAKEYVIDPGNADESELVQRITSRDPDLKMPPPDSERSLSGEQIELLRQWIDSGADYEEHWAFIPPERPLPPPTAAGDGSPIDHFIDAKLLEAGIDPAPPASRTTLIRRATFDLTGLPPTLEEIDTFLADSSEDAFERLLDRLLARHEYGERMAADWMDVARYSDTYGYQVDRDRFVWPWRDWVIKSFNDNMPYDQFITWQLAGDLLTDATPDQILATTFNRLHPQKVEGGSVPEEFRMEYVADRTQTVATALMGLTMECCRCHSHKYDPLTQREYYELSAFFDKIDEAGLYSFFTSAIPTPTLKLPTRSQQQQLDELSQRVVELELRLTEARRNRFELAAKAASEASVQAVQPESFLPPPVAELGFEEKPQPPNRSVPGVVGSAVQLTGDDPVKTKVGNFKRYEPFSVSLWIKTPDRKERAVVFHRSRAWTDAASRGYQLLIEEGQLSWSLIHFWPGNAIRVRTRETLPIDQWVHVTVTNDGSSDARGLQIFVDGHEAETEVVKNQLTRNITGGGGDHITIGERFRDRGFTNGAVDQFRVDDRRLTALEVLVLSAVRSGDHEIDVARLVGSESPAPLNKLLTEHDLERNDETIAQLREELKAARQAYCQLEDAIDEIMVMREMDSPRQSYLLQRGAYDRHGDPVEPGTPGVLGRFPDDQPRNRLGLARWLTADKHPLTARVAVNRLWQICFGVGLVRTPEDFGSQGKPPTHPELLDWLAVEFVENGWDVKHLLKQIMLSQTYRRSSSHPDPAVVQRDPENQLYARFPSYRLSAEMLRDNSLAISGRLVAKVGGPPVKPYEIEASFKPSKRDSGNGLYRRSLYTYWKRTGPAPAMMALDAAKRDVCRVRRERTSSPIQAFVLLNGPQYVEAARGLAEKLIAESNTDHPVLNEAELPLVLEKLFRILTSRSPSQQELEVLQGLYVQQLDYFHAHPERTKAYLEVGDAAVSPSLPQSQVAALAVVVNTVMNFDQSVMKR